MNTKLFFGTLIAAAALVVPAFATIEGSGTYTEPYTGTCQDLNPNNSEGTSSVVYIQNVTGGYWAAGSDSALTISSNLDISYATDADTGEKVNGTNGMTLTDGYSDTVYTFTGTITGNGDWTHTTSQSQKYIFTGSLAGYSGNITDTGQSGQKETYIHYGNGEQAATDTNVSGTGSVTVNGNITFNYGSYADTGNSQAITIGNSSLTGTSVEFTGSVNYEVSSALVGYNSSSTLTISNTGYTTTISGSISNFASVTVAENSTLAFSGSASIGSAITNSGTVVLNDSVVFALDGMEYTGAWSDEGGATYTLITGSSGTIKLGSDTLSNGEVSSLGTGNLSTEYSKIESATFTYDSGTLTVTVTGEYAVEGLNGTGVEGSPYFTAGTSRVIIPVSGDSNIFTEANTTVYLATDERSLGSESMQIYWGGEFTAACDIVIGKAGIYITDGTSGQSHTFTGKISGEGSITVSSYSGNSGSVNQHYTFTGDLSGWSGNFTITTVNTGDYVYFGNGGTAATNTSISGSTGSIAVDYGTVQYNYSGYASDDSEETALTVTNTSIEAHTIIFTGSVNYEVSSDLIGYDGQSTATTGSTLSITTTGTVTLTGTVSGFDIISVASASKLELAFKSDTAISGTTFSGAGTIEKSGDTTLTISGYTFGGTTTVSGGTLILTGETILGGSAEIHVETGATLDLTGVTNTQTSGDQNTRLDILYIEGGTVKVNNLGSGWNGQETNFGSAMYNGMIQISNGGVLEVTASQATDTAGRRAFAVTSGEGTYRYTGSGTSYITAENNRHIHLGSADDNATLIFEVVESGATLDVSMAIAYGMDTSSDATGTTSTGSLQKTGAGTLILSGTNLYSGGTTVSEGTLVVQNASALGSGSVSVASNATLQLDVAVSTEGTVTFNTDAKLVISGDLLASLATDTYAADDGAIAIISASNITFGGQSVSSLSGDSLDSLINAYVSAGGYTLSWTWDGGTLYAIVAAPEPSMFGLMFGLGALGLTATRRRRRKVA